MRRPPGRRVVGSSGPPSCSRRSSRLWFVVRAKYEPGSHRAVDRAKAGERPKTITAASTGRTVLRTSLRVAGQASVIDIRRFRNQEPGSAATQRQTCSSTSMQFTYQTNNRHPRLCRGRETHRNRRPNSAIIEMEGLNTAHLPNTACANLEAPYSLQPSA